MNQKNVLDQHETAELAHNWQRFQHMYWNFGLISYNTDGVHVHDVRKIAGVSADEITTEIHGKATVQLSVILHGVRFYSVHFFQEAQS